VKSVVAAFLKKPVMSLMVVAGICVLGSVALTRIPVGLLPNLASPGITIITRYPGVEAQKIEEILTVPIERQVSDISEIENMISVSSEGESKVNLVFSHDADVKVKILEASEKIFQIRSRFPREVQEPSIIQYDPGDRPVFIISFESDRIDLKKLREIIDRQVKPRFERIDGVSEVFVGGGYEREIQIIADPGRLAAHGTGVNQITGYIARSNEYTPGGKLPGETSRAVYTDGRFTSIAEIRNISIKIDKDKNPVGLSEFAQVVDSFRERDTISRTDGKEHVTIYIQKAGNANTMTITDEAEKISASLSLRDIQSSIRYNQGSFIRKAINSIATSCVSGVVIAIALLYVFLRRAQLTMLIALTIPCCMMATFFLMYLAGIEINVISLSGLALGGRMLIENSIVVCEAIEVFVRKGKYPSYFEAVFAAVNYVTAEIISATLATVIVFIPLIFTDPETRKLYYGLSVTVTISLIVSIVFSLTILPSFVLFVIRRTGSAKNLSAAGAMNLAVDLSAPPFLQAILRSASRPLALINSVDNGGFSRWVHKITLPMYRRIRTVLLIAIPVAALIPVLILQLKKEGLDPAESGEMEASVDLMTGTHLEKTEEIIREIETRLKSHPYVETVSAKIEKWHASIHIKLNAEGKNKNTDEAIDSLKEVTDPVKEAFIHFSSSSETQDSHELDIDFFGDDNRVLKQFVSDLSPKLQANVPGVKQVLLRFREPKGDLLIHPDRTRAALSGTDLSEIGSQVRHLLSGAVITKFYDGEREVDVRFLGVKESLQSPEDVRGMSVSFQGRSQPLSTLASFSESEGETRLWRKNKRKTVTITLRTEGRSLDQVTADVDRAMREVSFPKDVVYAFGDEYKKLEKSQKEMVLAVGLSILIIYLLLGGLFESFVQPAIVLVPIPLTWTGILCFLYVTNSPLNMSVYIGMIMLGGIMVNHSILVLTTINHFLEHCHAPGQKQLLRIILFASTDRIRPVIMTALVTIVDMLPMVFDTGDGSHLWRPLAITVSLGLSISLFVSLAIVPLASYLYYLKKYKIKVNKERELPLSDGQVFVES